MRTFQITYIDHCGDPVVHTLDAADYNEYHDHDELGNHVVNVVFFNEYDCKVASFTGDVRCVVDVTSVPEDDRKQGVSGLGVWTGGTFGIGRALTSSDVQIGGNTSTAPRPKRRFRVTFQPEGYSIPGDAIIEAHSCETCEITGDYKFFNDHPPTFVAAYRREVIVGIRDITDGEPVG